MGFDNNWKNFLEELYDPQHIDVASLKFKKTLPPEIWENNQMRPEVREAAEAIANEFFETLELDPSIRIKDIIATPNVINKILKDVLNGLYIRFFHATCLIFIMLLIF